MENKCMFTCPGFIDKNRYLRSKILITIIKILKMNISFPGSDSQFHNVCWGSSSSNIHVYTCKVTNRSQDSGFKCTLVITNYIRDFMPFIKEILIK